MELKSSSFVQTRMVTLGASSRSPRPRSLNAAPPTYDCQTGLARRHPLTTMTPLQLARELCSGHRTNGPTLASDTNDRQTL